MKIGSACRNTTSTSDYN